MSGKRPSDLSGAPGEPRHFKQTKLNFFTPASRSQPKKPNTASEERQENPTTATARTTRDEADPEEQKAEKEEEEEEQARSSSAPNSTDDTANTNPNTSTKPPPAITTTTTTTPRIRITDRTGDLFSAPPNTLLIHACNCVGSWGGGIALAFRNLYPEEFKIYRAHCARSTPAQLRGTALLIPPQSSSSSSSQERGRGSGSGHYIGCLFTSRGYGASRDAPGRILGATAPAMRELMRLVVKHEEEEETGGVGGIGEVRMCRINSGLFAVPWERSKRAVEEMELGEGEVPRCAEGGVLEVVAYEREE
ncbi:hypothetical protein C8A00DRAFT_46672 [Chaetomidium leptoderma]|uniref:ADP-ribose 1''-phosphate phosphatase n=1 Tax=Chaetomidium leptoderma TaxID=669021 RepID=A0AAN6ZS32_9PEZI|nr:hypothetical protein C8A00DRAFT_46672 [Chaetomidium leptoderma]